MATRIAAGAIVAGLAATMAAASSGGEAECACIDPWAQAPMQSRSGWDAAKGCLEVPGGACLPPGYGTSCQTWADPNPVCAGASPPERCASQWCYVDASTCWRPAASSVYVPEFQVSYATCGDLDDYSAAKHAAYLEGRRLRVSYPAVEAGFISLVRDGKRVGSFPTFMQGIFDRYNVTVKVVPISEASLDWAPNSTWSACVHDVALNRTDICIGDFWSTSERRLLAPFTSDVYQELLYLIAYTSQGDTLLQLMGSPFRPFTALLWLGIAMATVAASLVMYILESKYREKPVHHGVLRSLYTGFHSIIGATSDYEAMSPGGRIANLAFGLFIMIVIGSYTAELASFLVSHSTTTQVDSVSAGIDAGMKFCALGTSQNSLLALEPGLRKLYVPVVNAEDALVGMDAGLCQLAIVPKSTLEVGQSGISTPDTPDVHCNKTAVGKVVFTIGVSMPIRPDLQQPISWAMTSQMSEGKFDKATVEARRAYLGTNACVETEKVVKEGMKVVEMTGIFMILASGMVLGFLVNLFYLKCTRDAGKVEKKTDAPAEPMADGESATVEVTLHNFPSTGAGPQPRISLRFADVEGAHSNPEVGWDVATVRVV